MFALHDRSGYAISRQNNLELKKKKNLELHLGSHIDYRFILHWYACGADWRKGWAVGWSVYGHVITKFSQVGRLLHFLTHGAPLARFY